MKGFLNKISKRAWVRVVLITIFTAIITFSIYGEKVALCDGIGWDGQNYYETMQHFIPMIKHNGYDQYAIQRVMPWGLTNIIFALIGVEVTRDVAIVSGIIYNVLALILAIVFFFRISNWKQWKIETEILGFAFLFFTYPVLKMVGYYPVLSDIFGLTMGLMLCYYFFADKKWALVLCGLAGAFIWPTSPIAAFSLAFFPRKPLPVIVSNDSKTDRFLLKTICVLFASLPLLLLLYTVITKDASIMSCMEDICPLTIPISVRIVPFTCLCSCFYYYYLTSAFKISLTRTLKENFKGKDNWFSYGLFVVLFLATTGACRWLANSNPGALTTTQTLQCIALTSMTDPFVFIENHFIYYGLGFLLILILWKDVAKTVMQHGLGYLFVVALWALFSIRPEARVSIMYVVFPMISLLMVLDRMNIHPYAVAVAAVFSLIWSRFWYKINVPNMEKYFNWDNFEHYVDFPAQRYFMSQGHWQSHEMYYLFMAITLVVGIILYVGIRKQWFEQIKAKNNGTI